MSLALGSGGARGLAHIGVIEWLLEQGYVIGSVAGSSMGALVGGIYSANKLDVYTRWVSSLERREVLRLLDPAFERGGLFKGERVFSVLRAMIGEHAIEALPVAFTAVATDLASHEEVWLRQGPLFEAIRASVATPVFFTPSRQGGRLLVDGALANPLPLAPMLHQRGQLTIAVDLNGPCLPAVDGAAAGCEDDRKAWRERLRGQLRRRLRSASNASMRWITELAFATTAATPAAAQSPLHAADVTVQVPANACGVHEFWRAREVIDLGRACAARAFAAARGLAPARPPSAAPNPKPACSEGCEGSLPGMT